MRMTITRGLAVAAAVAAASAGLVSTSASAAPLAVAAFASSGSVAPSPASGTSSTVFTLTPPAGAACAGDSVSGGYRWQTFLVPSTVDPSTITFGATGPAGAGNAPLYDSTGSAVINKNTGLNTGSGGLLTPIPTYNFATGLPAAGKYLAGYACTIGGVPQKLWAGAITIGAASAYSTGWAPDAPVVASPLTFGDGTLAGTFTEAVANPAITGFTVTATPTSGPVVTAALAAGATSFSLTGLTNGVTYSVTVGATNSVATTTSTAVTGVPNPAPCAAATPSATPGSSKVSLTWTAPTCAGTLTGYTLSYNDVTTGGAVATQSLAAAATATTVSGLTPGDNYSFSLQAFYNSPYTGLASAGVTSTPLASAVLIQDVTVTRPVGALVMTQACGANGGLPARAATANFPLDLAAVNAVSIGSGVPTAPTIGGVADPNFNGNYPYPVDASGNALVYTTHCGLNLGTAKLITQDNVNPALAKGSSRNLAGQYFSASGSLNQVTLTDTRDLDAGWHVTGTMSAFVKTGGSNTNVKQAFSGDHLGWNPQLTAYSGNTFNQYAMQPTVGAAVEPNPQSTAAAGNINPLLATTGQALGAGKNLAQAPANHGLGMAMLDARLELLVPVYAESGVYTGTLTITAFETP